MYNLSNLEPKFKNFLLAENISSVTLRNYLSDFRHFVGWFISNDKYNDEIGLDGNIATLTSELIESYRNGHVKSNLPIKTINRRLSTLRKFFLFCQKEFLILDNPAKKVSNISLIKKTAKIKEIATPSSFDQPVKSNSNISPVYSLKTNISFIFIFFTFIFSIFFLSLKFKQPYSRLNIPDPLTNQGPNRFLAFRGKLLDNLGNPINTKTDVTFKLYSQPIEGKPLYTSSCVGETGAITPDVNGNARVLIGSDCDHSPLPAKIFIGNQNLYLGITVGADSEMEPRQNIPNVGYARNADTIQGLNIGNNNLTVPYINENGDLLIASNNTGIRSTQESANFSISSAETVTIESAQAGDVVLQATESGTIKLRTGGFSDSYTRLTINNEGNIGIGTLFPTYGFEVNDDIKITNGNRLILASASSDPTGENGAMYYNIQSNKFRCHQGGAWIDCFKNSENNSIGGIYEGNLNQEEPSNLESQIFNLKREIGELKSNLENINKTASENADSLITKTYNLIPSYISVREKIISPVIETTQIKSSNDLSVILGTPTKSGDSRIDSGQSGITNDNKGPLASLIIKGLEGKTVTSIDAAGNASFSGQIAAENLLINKDATIAGSLKANNIEAENITQLADKLKALEETTKTSTSEVNDVHENTPGLKSEINNIQKLLAEIKNEPLSNPQYYQKIDNDEQFNNLTMEQLTVTEKSNLYDLAVSNSAAIGNLLIQDNSILSLAWDLNLSALSTVNFFDDAVVISKDGNIRTKGKVIANEGVVTNKIEALNEGESVRIDNLALHNLIIDNKYLESTASGSIIASAENFEKNGLSIQAIETQAAIAGTGAIPANSQEIIIYNSKISDTSLIYLTSTSASLETTLTVAKKEPCGNITIEQYNNEFKCKPYFKVAIPTPTTSTLSFNWLIVN